MNERELMVIWKAVFWADGGGRPGVNKSSQHYHAPCSGNCTNGWRCWPKWSAAIGLESSNLTWLHSPEREAERGKMDQHVKQGRLLDRGCWDWRYTPVSPSSPCGVLNTFSHNQLLFWEPTALHVELCCNALIGGFVPHYTLFSKAIFFSETTFLRYNEV